MRTRMNRTIQALSFLLLGGVPLAAPAAPPVALERREDVRVIDVVVDAGYAPSRITVRQGERVRLRFVRKDWSGCTREVLIPAWQIRRTLPTNQPVVIDVPTGDAGEYEFRCGMNMVRGTITVSAR